MGRKRLRTYDELIREPKNAQILGLVERNPQFVSVNAKAQEIADATGIPAPTGDRYLFSA